MLGIPGELVDATEHLLAMADDWRPRKVDLGVVNGRCFTFSSGLGLDASVVERVDANPRMKARLGALLLHVGGRQHVLCAAICSPATAAGRRRRRARRSRASPRSCRTARRFTYFQDRPIEIAEGATLDSGALAGGVLHRATRCRCP